MKIVLVMFKDGERREFPLSGDSVVIGRMQDCNLRIPTRDVSRQHCEIDMDGQQVSIRDLGSTNGTFVNDKRVAETTLKAGDKLTIGPVVFFLQIDGQPTEFSLGETAPAAVRSRGGDSVTAVDLNEDDIDEILDLDDIDFELDEEDLELDDEK